MKNGGTKGFAIAGMLATMLAPAVVFAGKAGRSTSSVKCIGANGCKGKGICSTATHGCKGQNRCKGKGVTMEKDAKACETKGGKVVMAAKENDETK